MRKHDWANVILFGVVAGITLKLLWIFGEFLNERTESISLTILIMGTTGAGLILSYLIFRWYLSNRLYSNIRDQIEKTLSDVKGISDLEGNSPVLWHDLQKIRQETKTLAINLLGCTRVVFSIFALMVVTLEVLALANAAVFYLQTKRLEEQNILIGNQNSIQLSTFLNDYYNFNQDSRNRIVDVRKSIEFISNNLLFGLNSLDDLVTEGTTGEVNEVKMINFEPIVCFESCDSISVESLMTMVEAGPIRVTEENVESLRGYARLARAADLTSTFLLAWEDRDKLPQEAISAVEDKINFAGDACIRTELLDRVTKLWEGITHLGVAVRSTSLGSNSIFPNSEIEITPDEVRYFNTAIMTIALSLNEDGILPAGPSAAAMLFARGLLALEQDLVSLLDTCEKYLVELEKYQAELVEVKAHLSREGRALMESQSKIEGAELGTIETGDE